MEVFSRADDLILLPEQLALLLTMPRYLRVDKLLFGVPRSILAL